MTGAPVRNRGWTHHLIAAEACRRGAVPLCKDPLANFFGGPLAAYEAGAPSPVILMLAGFDATAPITELLPEAEQRLPDLVIGTDAHAIPEGYAVLPEGEGLVWALDGSPHEALINEMSGLGTALTGGSGDAYDLAEAHIKAGCLVTACRYRADGGAEMVLDPVSCVRGPSEHQSGEGVNLFRERPVTLRLPILCPALPVDVYLTGRLPCPGVRASAGVPGAMVETVTSSDGATTRVRLTVKNTALPWVDLDLSGHRQRIDAISVPVTAPQRLPGSGYDPLDAYAPSGALP